MTWALSKTKPAYLGKRSVDMQIAKGVGRVLVGFTLPDRDAPCPKENHLVIEGGDIVGRVTSAVRSPTLNKVIGLAYLPVSTAPSRARGSKFGSMAGAWSKPRWCRRRSTIPTTSDRKCERADLPTCHPRPVGAASPRLQGPRHDSGDAKARHRRGKPAEPGVSAGRRHAVPGAGGKRSPSAWRARWRRFRVCEARSRLAHRGRRANLPNATSPQPRPRFAIQGEAAPDMLSKLCAIDFRPHRFDDLSIAQTPLAISTPSFCARTSKIA